MVSLISSGPPGFHHYRSAEENPYKTAWCVLSQPVMSSSLPAEIQHLPYHHAS